MSISRLDLPLESMMTPQWWSGAIYKQLPGRGLVFQGYSKPRLQTFAQHVDSIMGTGRVDYRVDWVWWQNQWVRI